MSESPFTPCIRRLNNQLHVDFAASVYSTDIKRKREPTRTIYEEAEHSMKTAEKQRVLKSLTGSKRTHNESANATTDDRRLIQLMDAAASLAQMSGMHSADDANHKSKTTVETIAKVHEDITTASNHLIKSITLALAAKEELMRAQAVLIGTMQQ